MDFTLDADPCLDYRDAHPCLDGLQWLMSLALGHALIKILFTSRASAAPACGIPPKGGFTVLAARAQAQGSGSPSSFPSQGIWSRLVCDRLGQHSRQPWPWRAVFLSSLMKATLRTHFCLSGHAWLLFAYTVGGKKRFLGL